MVRWRAVGSWLLLPPGFCRIEVKWATCSRQVLVIWLQLERIEIPLLVRLRGRFAGRRAALRGQVNEVRVRLEGGHPATAACSIERICLGIV